MCDKKQYSEGLQELLVRWSKLEAWGISLRGIKLKIRHSRTRRLSTGHAWYNEHRIVITIGSNIGDACATLLHEMAHHAGRKRPKPARFYGHSNGFWRCLARAGEEVLGRPLPLPPGPANKQIDCILSEEFNKCVDVLLQRKT